MAEQQVPINQTQFSFEEPIFENQADYSEPKIIDPEQVAKDKKKKIVIMAIVGFFLVLVSLVVVVVVNKGS